MTKAYLPKASRLWHWVDFTGPDAQDFLHRVTTVHVRDLAPGTGSRGCFLTPQGKFRAFFTLWCLAPDSYAFELEGGQDDRWLKELLAAIDQFTFSERITVGTPSPLNCTWLFEEKAGLEKNQTQVQNGIRFCHHGSESFGRPWISVWGEFPISDTLSDSEIESWRIHALDPRVDHEVIDSMNPLEAGLVDAVAINKGCYPGQEIIEKISALGSPAKRLALLHAHGLVAGAKLSAQGIEVGIVTSASETEALAYMKKSHIQEGLVLESGPIRATLVRVAPYA